MQETTFKHAEAFCHMSYATKTGKVYGIFNTRDGVTPFNYVIAGEEVQHINWKSDRREVDYKPKVGDLIWRDKTEDEAKVEAEKRIEAFIGSPYEVKKGSEKYESIFKTLTEDFLRIPKLAIV